MFFSHSNPNKYNINSNLDELDNREQTHTNKQAHITTNISHKHVKSHRGHFIHIVGGQIGIVDIHEQDVLLDIVLIDYSTRWKPAHNVCMQLEIVGVVEGGIA